MKLIKKHILSLFKITRSSVLSLRTVVKILLKVNVVTDV